MATISFEIRCGSWTDTTSARERIRAVAGTLHEPRSTNWISEQADAAWSTTNDELQTLVKQGDPFEDTKEAVTAWEAGDWVALLQHNLADIERTRELAELAGRFVPSSDFAMKNLAPPGN